MGTRLAKEMGGKRAVAGARRRVSAAAGQGHQQQQDNETGVPENRDWRNSLFLFFEHLGGFTLFSPDISVPF